MSGLLRSLLLKSAKIQKKTDELQRIDLADWMTLVQLKQIARDMFLPSSRYALVPVRATRRHFRSVNQR